MKNTKSNTTILHNYILTFLLAFSVAMIIHKIEGEKSSYTEPAVAEDDQIFRNKTKENIDTHVVLKLINENLPNLIIQK